MKKFKTLFLNKYIVLGEKRMVNKEVRINTFTFPTFSLHYINSIFYYIYNILNKENLLAYISLMLFFIIFKYFSSFFFKIFDLIFFYPLLSYLVAIVSLFCFNELSKRKHNWINIFYVGLYSFIISCLAILFNIYGCSLVVECIIYNTYILYYWKDWLHLESVISNPAVLGPYNIHMNNNGNNGGNAGGSGNSGNGGNGGNGGRNPLDPQFIRLAHLHHNNWRPDEDYHESRRTGRSGYTYRDSPNNYENYEEYGQRDNKAWMHDVKPLLSHTYLHTPHLLSVSVRQHNPLRELIARDIDGIANALIRADRTIEELKQLKINVAMLQYNVDNHDNLTNGNDYAKLSDKDKELINRNLGIFKRQIEDEVRSREG